ncbi:MAG: hypothetical protein PHO41_00875 [Eubacteriales bacterium]|nr:hypothetical protein [Eubacteriales bacterium]
MQPMLTWYYYNHALLPATAPHRPVDMAPLHRKGFWRSVPGARPLLARWTTDFDCQEPTDWWYIIKDTPFELADIKAKYRYRINKGLKHFTVRVIDPAKYPEELYEVQADAFSAYPAKYRPKLTYEAFMADFGSWQGGLTFGAFAKADGSLAGYAFVTVQDGYVSFSVQKTRPGQEKLEVNAALVYSLLSHFRRELAGGMYISDGERNILHETNFQNYLEQTFRFRKAYGKLHLQYRPGVKQLVACLYPLRGMFAHFTGIHLFSQLNAVLKMEAIARKNRNAVSVKEGA